MVIGSTSVQGSGHPHKAHSLGFPIIPAILLAMASNIWDPFESHYSFIFYISITQVKQTQHAFFTPVPTHNWLRLTRHTWANRVSLFRPGMLPCP